MIFSPFVVKGQNCHACIGTSALLCSFIANGFKNASGGLRPWFVGEDSSKTEDCCGKLSSLVFS